MSKKERIAELERRVAELEQTTFILEAKVGVLERNKIFYYPVYPQEPYKITWGDSTGHLQWIDNGMTVCLHAGTKTV